MAVRGVRGATTVAANHAQEILDATTKLLQTLVAANDLLPDAIAAAYFTTTTDLNAAFPARAARQLGWHQVPLLDAWEIPVPLSLPLCIRVLLLVNTERTQDQMIPIYQGEAVQLRPDLALVQQEEQS